MKYMLQCMFEKKKLDHQEKEKETKI